LFAVVYADSRDPRYRLFPAVAFPTIPFPGNLCL